jgi:hypothetical protein
MRTRDNQQSRSVHETDEVAQIFWSTHGNPASLNAECELHMN